MIQSFKYKGLKLLFEKDDHIKILARDIQKLENILAVLYRTSKPEDIALPGFHLHPLKGRFKGFWSVTVRTNWRVIFKIKDSDIHDVDLIDYH